jgi:hypothetical protein
MKACDVCGNTYEGGFEVKFENSGTSHTFDCFECAIEKLAPKCEQCGVKVIGHGMQAEDEIYCSAHCARKKGYKHFVDHTVSKESAEA